MTTETFPVEVFATGHWLGRNWTEADLEEMARNHALLKNWIKPPAKLGHSEKQVIAQKDGQPALGYVAALRRVGQKLVADMANVPASFKELVRSGRYSRVSVEVYPLIERTPFAKNLPVAATGKVLSAVAFLGADVPEVKTLEDLGRFLAVEQLEFSEPAPGAVALTLSAGKRPATAAIPDPDVRAHVEAALANVRANLEQQLAAERTRWMKEIDTMKQTFTASDINEWPERDLHRGAVEEVLEALGIAPGDAKKLLLVRQLVAATRPDLDAVKPGFLQRVVETWPDFRADKAPMAPAGSAVDVPDSGKRSWAWPKWHRPGDPHNVSRSVTRAGHQDSTGAHDPLAKKVAAVAEREGIVLSSATPEQRDTVRRNVATEARDDVPLQGYAAQEAQRLGGRDNFDHLRTIANTHRLDLTRAGDRKVAEKLLWNAVGGTVADAATFDAAMAAVERRETRLNFAQAPDRVEAARIVARERPDLVSYGSPRSEATATTFREPARGYGYLSDEERERRFEDEVVRYLEERNLPASTHRGEAARHVAKMRPDLCPSYGFEREER